MLIYAFKCYPVQIELMFMFYVIGIYSVSCREYFNFILSVYTEKL